jgi:CheY-like chemotaxis protein
MNVQGKRLTILMTDDDEDDCQLVKEAMEEAGLNHDLRFLKDGGQLIDYLYRKGCYANPVLFPKPDIILLDLNMPVKGGLETLREIKANPSLQSIPVVIFTTSREQECIAECYAAGANSYLCKPVTFENLLVMVKHLDTYWFNVVSLPG